jgi:hypothetical protein
MTAVFHIGIMRSNLVNLVSFVATENNIHQLDLAEKLPNLKSLKVQGIGLYQGLRELLPVLSSNNGLESLELCDEIHDEAIILAVSRLSSLINLRFIVTRAHLLHETSLDAFSNLTSLQHLTLTIHFYLNERSARGAARCLLLACGAYLSTLTVETSYKSCLMAPGEDHKLPIFPKLREFTCRGPYTRNLLVAEWDATSSPFANLHRVDLSECPFQSKECLAELSRMINQASMLQKFSFCCPSFLSLEGIEFSSCPATILEIWGKAMGSDCNAPNPDLAIFLSMPRVSRVILRYVRLTRTHHLALIPRTARELILRECVYLGEKILATIFETVATLDSILLVDCQKLDQDNREWRVLTRASYE